MKILDSRFVETLEDDTTPQLGGNLDVNGHSITGLDISDDTTPQLGGSLDANDLEIGKPLFKDSAETTQALGSLSANTSISLDAGNIASLTVGAAITLSFTNPPATGKTGILVLEITNGAAYTLTVPTSVQWTGDTVPTLQSAGIDVLVFKTSDAGTIWRGSQWFTKAT